MRRHAAVNECGLFKEDGVRLMFYCSPLSLALAALPLRPLSPLACAPAPRAALLRSLCASARVETEGEKREKGGKGKQKGKGKGGQSGSKGQGSGMEAINREGLGGAAPSHEALPGFPPSAWRTLATGFLLGSTSYGFFTRFIH